MGKRAINFTNSEISMIFWLIGLILILIPVKKVYDFYLEVSHPVYGNPGLASQFSLIMFLLVISAFFFFLSMAVPNYMISKYNLNIFIDRITNPDFIGWLRFTKSKTFRSHIVKKGPLGQTKGVANDVNADVINNGDYTVTLPNGNKAIIVCDLLSHNVNLENNMGWQLIKRHYGGLIGFNAWEKAAEEGELLFEIKDDETKEEEIVDLDAEEEKS